eukprot:350847-Chlamydomonas_euryale.AAC.7
MHSHPPLPIPFWPPPPHTHTGRADRPRRVFPRGVKHPLAPRLWSGRRVWPGQQRMLPWPRGGCVAAAEPGRVPADGGWHHTARHLRDAQAGGGGEHRRHDPHAKGAGAVRRRAAARADGARGAAPDPVCGRARPRLWGGGEKSGTLLLAHKGERALCCCLWAGRAPCCTCGQAGHRAAHVSRQGTVLHM